VTAEKAIAAVAYTTNPEVIRKAIVNGLGFDPETHDIRGKEGQFPGALVFDRETGQAVRFFTVKQMDALGEDPMFLNGYAEIIEAEQKKY
jgi:hypothetical protein